MSLLYEGIISYSRVGRLDRDQSALIAIMRNDYQIVSKRIVRTDRDTLPRVPVSSLQNEALGVS